MEFEQLDLFAATPGGERSASGEQQDNDCHQAQQHQQGLARDTAELPQWLPKEPECEQTNLFPTVVTSSRSRRSRSPALQLSADVLRKWKTQVATYQHQVRFGQLDVQPTLFKSISPGTKPQAIDPFTLRLSPMSFYQMPTLDPGISCL